MNTINFRSFPLKYIVLCPSSAHFSAHFTCHRFLCRSQQTYVYVHVVCTHFNGNICLKNTRKGITVEPSKLHTRLPTYSSLKLSQIICFQNSGWKLTSCHPERRPIWATQQCRGEFLLLRGYCTSDHFCDCMTFFLKITTHW